MLLRNRLIFIVFFGFYSIILHDCRNNSDTTQQDVLKIDGKTLAKKYCVSCHQLPDPSLINRQSWVEGVLPAMARQLGVRMYGGEYYTDAKSTISVYEWQKIVEYYKNSSPIKLPTVKPKIAPLNDWSIFSFLTPKKANLKGQPAMTTLVAFNTNDQHLYSGDASNDFFKWDKQLNSTLVKQMPSPVTGAHFFHTAEISNGAVLTCIGVMKPINISNGKVLQIDLNSEKKTNEPLVFMDGLPRPIQTVAADFNKDGLMDYVVCGFGHDDGGLYLLKQQANHQFKKSSIREIPGGTQLITGDFNNDGWPDIMCLFAQADEGIWMFLNDKKGGFTTQNLLHFPAVYGSSSFQLIDFNHDGKPDILYTSGDNSDFSPVLKPYHGVYIFTNQGNWKFKQTYFYHIDGCTKAIAADFDRDGDLDIAIISYFNDFKNHLGFNYLEQTKPNQFTVHEIPLPKNGRWLTMEVADIDRDGRLDVILGNFSVGMRGLIDQGNFDPKWDNGYPLVVLKNNSLPKPKNWLPASK